MRTTISLPSDLFDALEQYAQSKGLSRSELCAHALKDYFSRHNPAYITTRLNAVYGGEEMQPEATASRTIGAGEFKAKCLQLMDEVREEGIELIITKRGKPVAKLMAVAEAPEAD